MANDIAYKLITKGTPPVPASVIQTFKSSIEPHPGDQIYLAHVSRWYKVENRELVMTSDDGTRTTDLYLSVTTVS